MAVYELEKVWQETKGDVPFDFLDLIPEWTYVPPCGHTVLYRTRLTVNDDDNDGIRWGYCRQCQDYFQVTRRTIEIAPRAGQLAMREKLLALAVDNGIISNRIAWNLWESGYRDEGTGVSKAKAKEIASEIGHPEKSRMVADVAHHGIVRVPHGEFDPVLGGRRTRLQGDKAADQWKALSPSGPEVTEERALVKGTQYLPNGFEDFVLERETLLAIVATFPHPVERPATPDRVTKLSRASSQATNLWRPTRVLQGVTNE
jgi:hypothetical protein